MRHVILLRHGESAEKQHGETDFDRVLTARGIVSIQQMALQLSNEKLIPDFVLASPATRTKQTSHLVVDAIGLAIEPHFERDIYNGDDAVYQNLIEAIICDWKCLMLVGHNPSISALIDRLTNKSSIGLHPGQAVVLEFENKISNSRLMMNIGPF
jgi:phosphohistidine phosphatase